MTKSEPSLHFSTSFSNNNESIAAVAETICEDHDQSIHCRFQGLGIFYGTLYGINQTNTPKQLGNDAFHKQEFEKAINMFTKAIEHIKDSPILYNNRALSYMKLQVHKRAVIDCDFVINKLDDKNLRAWLYRAAAYYKLGYEKNFERSIKWAKKNNSKELDTIEKFVNNDKSEKF